MTLPTSLTDTHSPVVSAFHRVLRDLALRAVALRPSRRAKPSRVRRVEGGFSLTEIMIALAIVSLVMGGAAVVAFGQFEKARKKETITMIHKVKDAVLQWRMDSTGEQCPGSLNDLVTAKILNKEPKDGWGKPFVMKCPGEHDTDGIDLLSFGKDGKEGTADDIKSWEDDK